MGTTDEEGYKVIANRDGSYTVRQVTLGGGVAHVGLFETLEDAEACIRARQAAELDRSGGGVR